jgi:hypothetical protein
MTPTYRAVRAAARFAFATVVITAMCLSAVAATFLACTIADRLLP